MVSIIIIAWNQKGFLSKSFPIIFKQNYNDFEVIVVDSDSTDGSLDLYKQFPVKVINYTGPKGRNNFNYATAFNLAVKIAKGDILVRLSGDVIPVDENWLSELVAPMSDQNVAGVYSQQIHSEDSDWHHKFLSFFMFSPYRDYFEKLARGFMFWGAAAAMRRSCYDKTPFREELRVGEDCSWGADMAIQGYKLVYAPKSKVIHDHHKKDEESFYAVLGSLKRFIERYPSYVFGMISGSSKRSYADFVEAFNKAYKEEFEKKIKK